MCKTGLKGHYANYPNVNPAIRKYFNFPGTISVMVPAPNLHFHLYSRLPSMFQPVNRVDTVFFEEKYRISYWELLIPIRKVVLRGKAQQ